MLTQIIVEEENKGRALLPTTFLRQLIGFYGDSLGGMVPRYLEQTMSAIARQQEQMRDAMQNTMGNLLPPGLEEIRRQNMAMMERAMSLFTPFYRPPESEPAPAAAPPNPTNSPPCARKSRHCARSSPSSMPSRRARAEFRRVAHTSVPAPGAP